MFLLKIPHHSRDSKEALNGNSIASATGYEVMAVREQVKKRWGSSKEEIPERGGIENLAVDWTWGSSERCCVVTEGCALGFSGGGASVPIPREEVWGRR